MNEKSSFLTIQGGFLLPYVMLTKSKGQKNILTEIWLLYAEVI